MGGEDMNDENKIDIIIAGNLKKLREKENLTLKQLSDRTGLSKVMLGQLEKGGGNPTINTIWKIAHALEVPYTALLESTGSSASVIRERDLTEQTSEDGHYHMFCYYPSSAERSFEWFRIFLDPHASYRSVGHGDRSYEYLIVEKGKLEIGIEDNIYHLKAGDSVSFKADGPHEYANPGDTEVSAYCINYYPVR
jgi:transcriptional regulator with XRE-family HTH domain